MIFSSDNIVQITLGVLIAFSVVTWGMIIFKGWIIWKVGHGNRAYAEAFWSASSLQNAAAIEGRDSALGRIAGAGFDVLDELSSGTSRHGLDMSGDIQSILERSLRQQVNKEHSVLEQGLALLASIGSTAPFVGLFGTVWGIMDALKGISEAKSASLDVVAGPIGEALVATAIGIAAAIPAVLAYNFFLRKIKSCDAELDYFATDFHNLAVKSSLKSNAGA
ncbi:MotA/TolQ/ExbB proton channel family protein [Candidatus Methylospira mobilis]|uniref:MotA/TolQ/ExbB proton channel family protein n=1 Tax=Candidatus Methylospira mobilis TaxID=1808979 RepID=UPI0018857AEF|nr:MotA/TolQ/ExbB proton channel family protein [Candidatus Methylospira mobilis]WNV06773.1 MotA/TolQ/ExbB proton channel family protein [Candidatus Methylospira mobilis]